MLRSGNEITPLAGLVALLICLSIAGSVFGGALYYTVDIPAQKVLGQAPTNARPQHDFSEAITKPVPTRPPDFQMHPDD